MISDHTGIILLLLALVISGGTAILGYIYGAADAQAETARALEIRATHCEARGQRDAALWIRRCIKPVLDSKLREIARRRMP